MAKVIKLTYGEKDYTLEYTRETASATEQNGFKIREIENLPITMIPLLIQGAFIAHHPYTKPELIDEIYTSLPDKPGFINALASMYGDALTTLFDEPDDKSGKTNWKANW